MPAYVRNYVDYLTLGDDGPPVVEEPGQMKRQPGADRGSGVVAFVSTRDQEPGDAGGGDVYVLRRGPRRRSTA